MTTVKVSIYNHSRKESEAALLVAEDAAQLPDNGLGCACANLKVVKVVRISPRL